VLSEPRLRELLKPFRPGLSSAEASQVRLYLELLLRWNQKINLTAIHDPETCVTRHFGESLFLATQADLRGNLLDIGSGAGFPGLALRIAFPDLAVTLLEPVAKKRAFLKEAARVCEFSNIAVRPDRLEEFAPTAPNIFDTATSRAVGKLDRLVPLAGRCLRPSGHLFLWLTLAQAASLQSLRCILRWHAPLPIPRSASGVILPGDREEARPQQ